MISWIVASHDSTILDSVLRPTLRFGPGDELIVVTGARSIAEAYNEGQARASQPVRCYVHHDVRILECALLREQLLKHCQPWMGMVGVVGCWSRSLPWWDGAHCGSVLDSRIGQVGPGRGGECAYLDGLLLATCQTVTWDETYPGWHLYDHDMCEQMLALGAPNWCLDNGHELVAHNTTGANDPDQLDGWHANLARFREKWGRS